MPAASEFSPYRRDDIEAMGLCPDRLPRHIAVIMDGNGRWAAARRLPRIEGHRRGVNSVRRVVEECSRLGLDQLTLYCLSSENWKRPRNELDLLMRLLKQYLVEERSEIRRQGLRFAVIGRWQELGPAVVQEIHKTIDLSRQNDGMRLSLALNYGSRQELTGALQRIARQAAAGAIDANHLSEETITSHLDTAGMPDPDLLIRTAGEMRLSNFLLWQSSYAELWVTHKCWPDFRPADLIEALHDYAKRDRRFGGLNAF